MCHHNCPWLCKPHFLLFFTLLEFVIRLLSLEVQKRAYLYSFMFWIPLLRTRVGVGIIDYVSLVPFWRFTPSESVICFSAFDLEGGATLSSSWWFRGFQSFGSGMCRRRNHWFCYFRLIFAVLTFRICTIFTHTSVLARFFFCSICASFGVDACICQPDSPRWSESHSFLRVMIAGSVVYLLIFKYCEGASGFFSFSCCITGTWVRMDATCWSAGRDSTVWTAMSLLRIIDCVTFSLSNDVVYIDRFYFELKAYLQRTI